MVLRRKDLENFRQVPCLAGSCQKLRESFLNVRSHIWAFSWSCSLDLWPRTKVLPFDLEPWFWPLTLHTNLCCCWPPSPLPKKLKWLKITWNVFWYKNCALCVHIFTTIAVTKETLIFAYFFRSMYTPNANLEKSRDTLTRILVYEKFIRGKELRHKQI